jgi:hemoglobin-like flavoprotein
MTPEELEAIHRTVRAVEAEPDRFAARFYDGLFALSPDTRHLFPDDMTEQRGKVVDELVFLAGAASDVPGFTARAKELGARHRHYGVRAEHYPRVEQALLDALAEVLGEQWTPLVEGAWRALYHLIAETMVEGASGELFSPT